MPNGVLIPFVRPLSNLTNVRKDYILAGASAIGTAGSATGHSQFCPTHSQLLQQQLQQLQLALQLAKAAINATTKTDIIEKYLIILFPLKYLCNNFKNLRITF